MKDGVVVHQTIVMLPGGRLAILGEPGETPSERFVRLLNSARAIAAVLQADFGAEDPNGRLGDFRRIADAAKVFRAELEKFADIACIAAGGTAWGQA